MSVPADKLAKLKIRAAGGAKHKMLDELLRMKINEFTIYNDLDQLSKDLKCIWASSQLCAAILLLHLKQAGVYPKSPSRAPAAA